MTKNITQPEMGDLLEQIAMATVVQNELLRNILAELTELREQATTPLEPYVMAPAGSVDTHGNTEWIIMRDSS